MLNRAMDHDRVVAVALLWLQLTYPMEFPYYYYHLYYSIDSIHLMVLLATHHPPPPPLLLPPKAALMLAPSLTLSSPHDCYDDGIRMISEFVDHDATLLLAILYWCSADYLVWIKRMRWILWFILDFLMKICRPEKILLFLCAFSPSLTTVCVYHSCRSW